MNKEQEKVAFLATLRSLTDTLGDEIRTEDGQWTVKGFIDVYRSIYTISSDTKIVSKILEIHLFPKLLAFAEELGFCIVLADASKLLPRHFVREDLQSRLEIRRGLQDNVQARQQSCHFCNGFTLGSHGKYFTNRSSPRRT